MAAHQPKPVLITYFIFKYWPTSVYIKADDIWNDTTISTTNTTSNKIITLNGNLTIANGGILTLTNVTLMVNCTFNGEHRIEVRNNGTLYINGGSIITALNTSNSFLFWVDLGAIFQMNNSELHYCGYFSTSNIETWGLWINTNNTIIENNTLTNNYLGIVLQSAYNNTVINNTATNNNGLGYYLYNSSYNNLSGNTATNNNGGGFELYSSSYNNLSGNTATNSNNYGFYLYSNSSNNNLPSNLALNCTAGYYRSPDSTNNNFTGSKALNYLRVNVTDGSGSPITGADVKVDTDGIVVYATPHFGGSNSTTVSGVIPWIPVQYGIFTTGDSITLNTTTVTVWNSTASFSNNPRTVDTSWTHVETFQVGQPSSPPEQPLLLPVVFYTLMSASVQGGVSPLVYVVIGVAIVAGVIAALIYHLHRKV